MTDKLGLYAEHERFYKSGKKRGYFILFCSHFIFQIKIMCFAFNALRRKRQFMFTLVVKICLVS